MLASKTAKAMNAWKQGEEWKVEMYKEFFMSKSKAFGVFNYGGGKTTTDLPLINQRKRLTY